MKTLKKALFISLFTLGLTCQPVQSSEFNFVNLGIVTSVGAPTIILVTRFLQKTGLLKGVLCPYGMHSKELYVVFGSYLALLALNRQEDFCSNGYLLAASWMLTALFMYKRIPNYNKNYKASKYPDKFLKGLVGSLEEGKQLVMKKHNLNEKELDDLTKKCLERMYKNV